MSINQTIKNLRSSRGWTQAELAEKLNTTQKTIATYETSTRLPSLEKLIQIAQVFGVSTDAILGVKKITVKETAKNTHKNKRSVKAQNLFEKLHPNDQRSLLKQIKALATAN